MIVYVQDKGWGGRKKKRKEKKKKGKKIQKGLKNKIGGILKIIGALEKKSLSVKRPRKFH